MINVNVVRKSTHSSEWMFVLSVICSRKFYRSKKAESLRFETDRPSQR